MPSIGSFILTKNEAPWIGAHLEMWLPHLSEMVLFDGNSTDGTLEIILDVIRNHAQGHKVRLFTDKDPKNLQDDYTRVFNECLHSVESDLAFFLHPDMVPHKVPANFEHLGESVAASVSMRTFAGEPDGQLLEIVGRAKAWSSISRLNNPDLGAVYHGHYGVWNEGVYPTAIVGESRELHNDLSCYPYEVEDSGIEILHFSDVRPYARRLDRMRKCLANQGHDVALAESHPRVTLKAGGFKQDSFNLVPAEWPIEFVEARAKYAHLEKTLAHV